MMNIGRDFMVKRQKLTQFITNVYPLYEEISPDNPSTFTLLPISYVELNLYGEEESVWAKCQREIIVDT